MSEQNDIIPLEENRVYFLFRRGQKEHIQALYEEGYVYINTIDFIRQCDDNKERSDEDDGISYRHFLGDGKVTFYDLGKEINTDGITMEAINIISKNDNELKGNIYCLTGIYSEDLFGEREDITIDTKSFGDTVLLIHSPSKFLDRIFQALEKEDFKNYEAKKVHYYKNDYSGNIGFFKKHERFKPQREFRIFIQNDKNSEIKLKIGSLEDIASINSNIISFKYTDGKEQIIKI